MLIVKISAVVAQEFFVGPRSFCYSIGTGLPTGTKLVYAAYLPEKDQLELRFDDGKDDEVVVDPSFIDRLHAHRELVATLEELDGSWLDVYGEEKFPLLQRLRALLPGLRDDTDKTRRRPPDSTQR